MNIRRLYFILLLIGTTALLPARSETIYVSPDGNDAFDGRPESPKATLHAALRQARNIRRLQTEPLDEALEICLLPGVYEMDRPLYIRPEDSGTPQSPTVIRAEGEGVVLSGGRVIPASEWHKARRVKGLPKAARGKVWVCPQPKVAGRYVEFRQLWADGVKAQRARTPNDDSLPRILAWDKEQEVMSIPVSALPFAKPDRFQTLDGMEMLLHQMWAVANLRIAGLDCCDDTCRVRFHQPESLLEAEHPWPTPMTQSSLESPFFLSNAIEFLDSAGEWYLDTERHKLYYYPREGEDMSRLNVVFPYLETLVLVEGPREHPVTDIRFEGLRFEYTTWMRPSFEGHVALQAGMYLTEAYKLRPSGVPGNPNRGLENQAWLGRPAAAVSLRGVARTTFSSCTFTHLASCALDYVESTDCDSISGCVFTDIGGNGIQAGRFAPQGLESHLPYNPADEREYCRHLYIGDNLLDDCSNEDWGCVGILAGYVRNILIEHNEIRDVSYSGISLGWGWQKAPNVMCDNVVRRNYIHRYARHMYDVAGIYTLSSQPGTDIYENVVDSIYHPFYVHDPHHWFYLYTDEGSSYIHMHDNWCPEEKFLQNANGPGNLWENNGPMVSEEIRRRAGRRL